MNLWDGTTQRRVENLWRYIRHCEQSPNCKVVRRDENNNSYPAIIPTQTIAPGVELTINFRFVSPALLDGFPELATIVAEKLAARDEAKMLKLGPLIEANELLYRANKKLSAENATLEAKLVHVKRTINALVSKIGAQTGKPAGNTGELTQRLRDAVRVLQTQSSHEDAGKPPTAPVDSNSLEVMMLTEQLKKLNVSNERLAAELVDLKYQQAALRNQKKEAAGHNKH